VSRWLRNSFFLLLLAGLPAWGAPDDALVVTALRNPVDKSYRRMVRGMDLFAEMRALAPQAALRYRLLPRRRDTDMQDVALHVVGKSFDEPLAVAADGTFTLARDARALDENAVVRSERRANSLTWRAEVRTPGLAPGVRRLGDLRLECLVGMEAGLVSRYPSLFGRLFDLLDDPRSFCGRRDVPYLFFAERALFGVTLVSGSRRESVALRQLYAGTTGKSKDREHCDCAVLVERAYDLPLGERSWPDDTRVEFDFMDEAAQAEGWTREQLVSAFGAPKVLRFDNGYELWAYEWDERNEFVALVDRSGRVTKTRLRQPS